MSAKRAKAVDEWAWFTKAQAAAVTGYSVRNFSERLQPRLDPAAERGKGAKKRFDIRLVVAALAAYVAEQNKPKPEELDPLMGAEGQTSDALEQYRREATIEKQLKNAVTRRELVDRARVLQALNAGFATAATSGKKLEIRFGRPAVDLWNQSINAMRTAAKNALGETDASGGIEQ